MIDKKGRDYLYFPKNNSNSGFSIHVSKGSTNGDIIKALFPCEDLEKDFDFEWWNAPYKRGETNE